MPEPSKPKGLLEQFRDLQERDERAADEYDLTVTRYQTRRPTTDKFRGWDVEMPRSTPDDWYHLSVQSHDLRSELRRDPKIRELWKRLYKAEDLLEKNREKTVPPPTEDKSHPSWYEYQRKRLWDKGEGVLSTEQNLRQSIPILKRKLELRRKLIELARERMAERAVKDRPWAIERGKEAKAKRYEKILRPQMTEESDYARRMRAMGYGSQPGGPGVPVDLQFEPSPTEPLHQEQERKRKEAMRWQRPPQEPSIGEELARETWFGNLLYGKKR